MARVTTYLNFMGDAEEAFTFYADVFGTAVEGPVARIGDAPMPPGAPELSDEDKQKVMHIVLPILDGHRIMATDMVESMGHELHLGNNMCINLEPDTRDEALRLYAALSEGGTDCNEPMEMPWGLWGMCQDRFGIRWMFNVGNDPA